MLDDSNGRAGVFDQYVEERRQYIDAARESARTFDKAVLTFGSAVFGFSIAFVKDIAPTPALCTLSWLEAAWLLFALGLLAILLSFLFSHQACMREISACEEFMAGTHEKSSSGSKKNPWSIITTCCNYVCIALLFSGLVCWSVFAIDNMRQGAQPMKDDSGVVKKGYVPPPAPARGPAQQPTTPPPSSPAPKK